MRELFRFIHRFHFFFVFVALEIVSLSLLVNYNVYQRAKFYNSSDEVIGTIYNSYYDISQYIGLKSANHDLLIENSNLRNKISHLSGLYQKSDSSVNRLDYEKYVYIPAHIISNSVYNRNNYLTIDKGRLLGVGPEMAVVSPNGIVGVTRFVSDNYSAVISVLNSNLSISTKIKKNNYFGSLVWTGNDYSIVELREIPVHVNISIGDTLVTSGYSAMFPEGIPIGTIVEYKQNPGDSFYFIRAKLVVDYKSVTNVYVINNLHKNERINLEEKAHND